jgi:hypothetical protein
MSKVWPAATLLTATVIAGYFALLSLVGSLNPAPGLPPTLTLRVKSADSHVKAVAVQTFSTRHGTSRFVASIKPVRKHAKTHTTAPTTATTTPTVVVPVTPSTGSTPRSTPTHSASSPSTRHPIGSTGETNGSGGLAGGSGGGNGTISGGTGGTPTSGP